MEERIIRYCPAGATLAVLDHTGGHYVAPLAAHLRELGCTVVLVSESSAKELREQVFLSESRTDAKDAKTLAYAGYLQRVLGVHVPFVDAERRATSASLLLVHL